MLIWSDLSSHLADLVEGVLSITIRVLEIVMGGESAVDVPGDDAFLGWVLQHTHSTYTLTFKTCTVARSRHRTSFFSFSTMQDVFVFGFCFWSCVEVVQAKGCYLDSCTVCWKDLWNDTCFVIVTDRALTSYLFLIFSIQNVCFVKKKKGTYRVHTETQTWQNQSISTWIHYHGTVCVCGCILEYVSLQFVPFLSLTALARSQSLIHTQNSVYTPTCTNTEWTSLCFSVSLCPNTHTHTHKHARAHTHTHNHSL